MENRAPKLRAQCYVNKAKWTKAPVSLVLLGLRPLATYPSTHPPIQLSTHVLGSFNGPITL